MHMHPTHAALFLNAGEELPAENLVLWNLTGAFQEFRRFPFQSLKGPLFFLTLPGGSGLNHDRDLHIVI